MSSIKLMGVVALCVFALAIYLVLNKEPDLEMADLKAIAPAQKFEPTPQAASPAIKVVSIPAPLRLAQSDALQAKKTLKQPAQINTHEPLEMQQLGNSKETGQTQIAASVMNKITESTGIPTKDIEQAMNKEAE